MCYFCLCFCVPFLASLFVAVTIIAVCCFPFSSTAVRVIEAHFKFPSVLFRVVVLLISAVVCVCVCVPFASYARRFKCICIAYLYSRAVKVERRTANCDIHVHRIFTYTRQRHCLLSILKPASTTISGGVLVSYYCYFTLPCPSHYLSSLFFVCACNRAICIKDSLFFAPRLLVLFFYPRFALSHMLRLCYVPRWWADVSLVYGCQKPFSFGPLQLHPNFT